MPRAERPLDAEDSALLRFAKDLRRLRQQAGGPTYREIAGQAHYSAAALSEAAAGRKLPSLPVTLAYVRACGGDAEQWERRWHAVAAELAAPEPGEQVRGSGDERSPYVGLAAFQTEDADRFFGRERLVDDVLGRLARQRFLAVFGASGAGKSSLLRAGVVPRWRAEREHRTVVLFTPGPHPLEECAIALSRASGCAPGALDADLRADPRGLHRIIRHSLTGHPEDAELMLVVDQFEEIFTLCRSHDERHRFIQALLVAAGAGNSRCRVVVGVRADFYAHCTAFTDLVAALRDSQVIVGPMSRDELRRAIVQPAVRSGYTVETALLTELVAQVNGQIGVLPLLSHALLETWRRRRGNTLTMAGFQAAGGIEGALAQTAESAYADLPQRRQQVARDLMVRLTALGDGTDDTKRRVSRGELNHDPDTHAVLDLLVRARLVAVDRDAVEISHEALIRSWPRLRDWLTEDREGLRLHRELTEATDAWEALGRDSSALFRGIRLARVREWTARRNGALSARERQFLAASLAWEQREQRLAQRRSRRLRQAVVLLSVLLVLAVTTTSYAMDAQRSAARQRNTALSQIVAGKALSLRRTDPTLAVQLSLAAYRLAPTAEARTSLLAAFPFPYPRHLSGHTANVNTVAFSPDGRLLVTASHDGNARLWDTSRPAAGKPLGVLAGHTANVNAAAFSPDGQLVATASWDHTVKLWQVTDPRHPVELATLAAHSDHVNAVAFSSDGRTLATTSTDRTAKLWDVTRPAAPRALRTLTGHTDTVVSAAFRPDGTMLATASFDQTIALWDLTGRRPPKVLGRQPGPVTWLAFSPDGTRLASAGHDKTARLWDPVSGRELAVLAGHQGGVRSVAFSPDGRLLATASEDRTARMWDLSEASDPSQVALLDAHADWVVSVAFAPDGRTLATASDDDTAVLWKVPTPRPDQVGMAQVQAWACEVVYIPISKAQWARYFPGVDYRPPCPPRPRAGR